MSIVIHTKDLVKHYRARTVVNHVSIEVRQGEIVGLLGPNGAGKTTTFYMTVGLIQPDEGEVYLNDLNITRLPMYKRAQMGIGYLPQEASVFRKLSVEDNILAVLEMRKFTRAGRREKLESLLREFRLEHVRKSPGDVLSGGERRRTEIARALAVDPKFILLDEPFAGIDPIAVEDIQSIVAKLKFKNIGILITDHNVTETLSICDRAYLLIEGKIFKHGTAEELSDDDQVKRLYLGRNFELKRKDYLLDEFRNQPEVPATTAVSDSVQNAINWIDQINADLSRKLTGPLSALGGTELASGDNTPVEELHHFLHDLIPGLKSFADANRVHEIKSIIPRLNISLLELDDEHVRTTLQGDLSSILLELDALQSDRSGK